MNGAKIASDIAKILLAEKKMKLDARVDEIAREKGMSIVERAKFRARAVEALDNGELVL
tara:strand:+ start:604 stop:780 length:177 start_codon:yes stop_codon:yes gene_type:complete